MKCIPVAASVSGESNSLTYRIPARADISGAATVSPSLDFHAIPLSA
jgi:hypothetical protein